MSNSSIFLPALGMVALTFLVWLRMYATRVAQMKRDRIHPQSVALSAQMAAKVTDSRASDNFRNLFELPVLFYLAVVVAAISGISDGVTLGLAWAFVVLRIAHSVIHCSYNRVMHRFTAYLLGGISLWLLWAWLAMALLGMTP
ncbi:MAG: MAPEG family protein [Lysobacteraceae bacterium]